MYIPIRTARIISAGLVLLGCSTLAWVAHASKASDVDQLVLTIIAAFIALGGVYVAFPEKANSNE